MFLTNVRSCFSPQLGELESGRREERASRARDGDAKQIRINNLQEENRKLQVRETGGKEFRLEYRRCGGKLESAFTVHDSWELEWCGDDEKLCVGQLGQHKRKSSDQYSPKKLPGEFSRKSEGVKATHSLQK